MKTIDLIQGTSDWHGWREDGVGGSESSAIHEESPYITRRDLWFLKKGLLTQEDNGEKDYIFQRGHDAEAKMRGEIFALLGHTFEPICVEHETLPFIRASLDGYSDHFGVLEAKLVGKAALANALKGELPRHHWIQMQHQMIAAGCNAGKYFCSDLKDNGAIVDVSLDKEFAKLHIEKTAEFWDSLKRNIAPPLSDRDTLIPENSMHVRLFMDLARIRTELDKMTAEYEAILEELKTAYPHPKVECAGVKFLKINRQGSISYAKIPELKNLDPEYLEKFRGSPTSYVKVSFKGL